MAVYSSTNGGAGGGASSPRPRKTALSPSTLQRALVLFFFFASFPFSLSFKEGPSACDPVLHLAPLGIPFGGLILRLQVAEREKKAP